jgi:hypothetical protein
MSTEGIQAPAYDEAAFAALRREAEAGRLDVMTEVGDRLLVGREAPFEPHEAVALLTKAAERGAGEALDRLATLAAAGAWMPQSFGDALAFLSRAAIAGSASARGQLLLLAEDPALAAQARSGADAPEVWRDLASSVRMESWTEPRQRRVMSEQPRIRVVDGFVTPEICAWVIGKARGKLKPALMYNGKDNVPMPMRSNSDFIFDITAADVLISLLRLRIAATTHIPVQAQEPFQVFHYALGQEIRAHFDHVRDSLSFHGKSDSDHERIATFLIYLNHDYDGGELEFPRTGFRFKGQTGDAIFFANVTPEGKPDPLSLHAALPILRGEKWMVSQWIQDRQAFSAA